MSTSILHDSHNLRRDSFDTALAAYLQCASSLDTTPTPENLFSLLDCLESLYTEFFRFYRLELSFLLNAVDAAGGEA